MTYLLRQPLWTLQPLRTADPAVWPMSTGFFIRDLFYTTTTTQAISHRVLLKMKMVGNVLFYYIFLISIKHPSLGYNLHYLSLLAQESSSQKPGNARMTKLTEEQKESISAMASPSCMDSAERKRQYAAMGRAITKTCNPSLLAKYQLCSDTERWGVDQTTV